VVSAPWREAAFIRAAGMALAMHDVPLRTPPESLMRVHDTTSALFRRSHGLRRAEHPAAAIAKVPPHLNLGVRRRQGFNPLAEAVRAADLSTQPAQPSIRREAVHYGRSLREARIDSSQSVESAERIGPRQRAGRADGAGPVAACPRHLVVSGSFLSAIDHNHVDGRSIRFEFESQLFL